MLLKNVTESLKREEFDNEFICVTNRRMEWDQIKPEILVPKYIFH